MDVFNHNLFYDSSIHIFLGLYGRNFIGRKFYCLSTSGSPSFPGMLEDYTSLSPGS